MSEITKSAGSNRGFALLVAVLVSSVILAVGLSIATITLKQYVFSGIGRESEIAFYAADAGMECALYWDASSAGGKFNIGNSRNSTSATCMGNTSTMSLGGITWPVESGETMFRQIDWGVNPAVCVKIYITKYEGPAAPAGSTCPTGSVCTVVESRGYNRSCAVVDTGADPRTVERALRARY